jgi:hypothetical protein
VFISCGDAGSGDQACGAVHANVRFHAEVPLPDLVGLVHFRVTGLILILPRAERCNNGGVHDSAAAQLQAIG